MAENEKDKKNINVSQQNEKLEENQGLDSNKLIAAGIHNNENASNQNQEQSNRNSVDININGTSPKIGGDNVSNGGASNSNNNLPGSSSIGTDSKNNTDNNSINDGLNNNNGKKDFNVPILDSDFRNDSGMSDRINNMKENMNHQNDHNAAKAAMIHESDGGEDDMLAAVDALSDAADKNNRGRDNNRDGQDRSEERRDDRQDKRDGKNKSKKKKQQSPSKSAQKNKTSGDSLDSSKDSSSDKGGKKGKKIAKKAIKWAGRAAAIAGGWIVIIIIAVIALIFMISGIHQNKVEEQEQAVLDYNYIKEFDNDIYEGYDGDVAVGNISFQNKEFMTAYSFLASQGLYYTVSAADRSGEISPVSKEVKQSDATIEKCGPDNKDVKNCQPVDKEGKEEQITVRMTALITLTQSIFGEEYNYPQQLLQPVFNTCGANANDMETDDASECKSMSLTYYEGEEMWALDENGAPQFDEDGNPIKSGELAEGGELKAYSNTYELKDANNPDGGYEMVEDQYEPSLQDWGIAPIVNYTQFNEYEEVKNYHAETISVPVYVAQMPDGTIIPPSEIANYNPNEYGIYNMQEVQGESIATVSKEVNVTDLQLESDEPMCVFTDGTQQSRGTSSYNTEFIPCPDGFDLYYKDVVLNNIDTILPEDDANIWGLTSEYVYLIDSIASFVGNASTDVGMRTVLADEPTVYGTSTYETEVEVLLTSDGANIGDGISDKEIVTTWNNPAFQLSVEDAVIETYNFVSSNNEIVKTDAAYIFYQEGYAIEGFNETEYNTCLTENPDNPNKCDKKDFVYAYYIPDMYYAVNDEENWTPYTIDANGKIVLPTGVQKAVLANPIDGNDNKSTYCGQSTTIEGIEVQYNTSVYGNDDCNDIHYDLVSLNASTTEMYIINYEGTKYKHEAYYIGDTVEVDPIYHYLEDYLTNLDMVMIPQVSESGIENLEMFKTSAIKSEAEIAAETKCNPDEIIWNDKNDNGELDADEEILDAKSCEAYFEIMDTFGYEPSMEGNDTNNYRNPSEEDSAPPIDFDSGNAPEDDRCDGNTKPDDCAKIWESIQVYSIMYGIDPEVVWMVNGQESAHMHDPSTCGPSSGSAACGTMQIENLGESRSITVYNQDTNKDEEIIGCFGPTPCSNKNNVTQVDLTTIEGNVQFGVAMIVSNISSYHYNIPAGLLAYNYGSAGAAAAFEFAMLYDEMPDTMSHYDKTKAVEDKMTYTVSNKDLEEYLTSENKYSFMTNGAMKWYSGVNIDGAGDNASYGGHSTGHGCDKYSDVVCGVEYNSDGTAWSNGQGNHGDPLLFMHYKDDWYGTETPYIIDEDGNVHYFDGSVGQQKDTNNNRTVEQEIYSYASNPFLLEDPNKLVPNGLADCNSDGKECSMLGQDDEDYDGDGIINEDDNDNNNNGLIDGVDEPDIIYYSYPDTWFEYLYGIPADAVSHLYKTQTCMVDSSDVGETYTCQDNTTSYQPYTTTIEDNEVDDVINEMYASMTDMNLEDYMEHPVTPQQILLEYFYGSEFIVGYDGAVTEYFPAGDFSSIIESEENEQVNITVPYGRYSEDLFNNGVSLQVIDETATWNAASSGVILSASNGTVIMSHGYIVDTNGLPQEVKTYYQGFDGTIDESIVLTPEESKIYYDVMRTHYNNTIDSCVYIDGGEVTCDEMDAKLVKDELIAAGIPEEKIISAGDTLGNVKTETDLINWDDTCVEEDGEYNCENYNAFQEDAISEGTYATFGYSVNDIFIDPTWIINASNEEIESGSAGDGEYGGVPPEGDYTQQADDVFTDMGCTPSEVQNGNQIVGKDCGTELLETTYMPRPFDNLQTNLEFASTEPPYASNDPHKGIDVDSTVNESAPIYASGNGVVTSVNMCTTPSGEKVTCDNVNDNDSDFDGKGDVSGNDTGLCGNSVTITYYYENENVTILYCHLGGFGADIEPGAIVNENTMIGTIGNTGKSTGSHLHMAFNAGAYYVPGNVTDPTNYINFPEVGAPAVESRYDYGEGPNN